MKTNTRKWIQALMGISIIVIILLLPIIYYSYNENYYKKQFAKHNVYSNLPEADEYAENIIGFLRGRNELTGDYTLNEISHMEDVRNLYRAADTLIAIATIIILGAVMIGVRTRQRKEYYLKPIIISSIIIIGAAMLALITALLDFTWFFTAFHEVFFPMGNWAFPRESTLITVFPKEFFAETTTRIFTAIITISLIAGTSSYLYQKKK